jgi:hypothetical protein
MTNSAVYSGEKTAAPRVWRGKRGILSGFFGGDMVHAVAILGPIVWAVHNHPVKDRGHLAHNAVFGGVNRGFDRVMCGFQRRFDGFIDRIERIFWSRGHCGALAGKRPILRNYILAITARQGRDGGVRFGVRFSNGIWGPRGIRE